MEVGRCIKAEKLYRRIPKQIHEAINNLLGGRYFSTEVFFARASTYPTIN
jgi:hypothetical protein